MQQEGSMPDMGQLALWDEDEEMADLEGQQLDDMTALLQELRERGLDPEMLVLPRLDVWCTVVCTCGVWARWWGSGRSAARHRHGRPDEQMRVGRLEMP